MQPLNCQGYSFALGSELMSGFEKNKSPWQALVALRTLLYQMETDIGLIGLTAAERDVLLAAHAVSSEEGGVATSDGIRSHILASELPQASYHRALRHLLSAGLLQKAPGTKAGRYVIPDAT
jgi:hypothetical protein